MQHYEYFKSLQYAKMKFPQHSWYISLVGSSHAYTYREAAVSSAQKHYLSIVDLVGGIYIRAQDVEEKLIKRRKASASYVKISPAEKNTTNLPAYVGSLRSHYVVRASSPSAVQKFETPLSVKLFAPVAEEKKPDKCAPSFYISINQNYYLVIRKQLRRSIVLISSWLSCGK